MLAIHVTRACIVIASSTVHPNETPRSDLKSNRQNVCSTSTLSAELTLLCQFHALLKLPLPACSGFHDKWQLLDYAEAPMKWHTY